MNPILKEIALRIKYKKLKDIEFLLEQTHSFPTRLFNVFVSKFKNILQLIDLENKEDKFLDQYLKDINHVNEVLILLEK